MNRNSEYNFAQNPQVGVSRSRFQRNSDNKTTFNTGDLIPIYLDEVLPGDTHQVDVSCVMRMATPIFPVMDNAYCDFYFFFVPNRLLWEHWKEFMGENKETAWTPKTEYSVPQVKAPENGWEEGTLADYLGLPTKVRGISVSALPGRAYGLIYNEWFRNQNVTQPTLVEVTDATTTGKNDGSATNDSARYCASTSGLSLLTLVCRFRSIWAATDCLSTCLRLSRPLRPTARVRWATQRR